MIRSWIIIALFFASWVQIAEAETPGAEDICKTLIHASPYTKDKTALPKVVLPGQDMDNRIGIKWGITESNRNEDYLGIEVLALCGFAAQAVKYWYNCAEAVAGGQGFDCLTQSPQQEDLEWGSIEYTVNAVTGAVENALGSPNGFLSAGRDGSILADMTIWDQAPVGGGAFVELPDGRFLSKAEILLVAASLAQDGMAQG